MIDSACAGLSNSEPTDRTKSRSVWHWILLAGVLSVAAFPPAPLGGLAYFALLPFIYSLFAEDFHFGFGKGYCYGLILNAGILYWLALNKGTTWYYGTISMLAGVTFLALNYGLIGMVVGFIGRRGGANAGLWSLPFVWTAVEYLRTFGTLGFTWNNLAYTQAYALPLVQSVAVVGSGGLSFWVVLINVVLFRWWQACRSGRSGVRWGIVVIGLFGIPVLYGWQALQSETPSPRRQVAVSLIQPNVDPNAKWDRQAFFNNMQLLHDLTDSACQQPRDLVVWPETATPTFLRRNHYQQLTLINQHINRLGIHLLSGVPDYAPNGDNYRIYNAAFLLRPGTTTIEDYRKLRLVPFGEYIPLSGYFPELKRLNLGQGNFDAGDSMRVFKMPLRIDHRSATDTTLTLSVVICYESTFPELVREATRRGAELLVVVSNDAWFGYTSAPFLHAAIARFRAVENRIPVVRAANTGISLIYDQYGRTLQRLGFAEQGYLAATVEQGTPHTLFTRWGNWWAVLSVIVSGGWLGWAVFRKGTYA